jgi:signal transduction histidine kinase
LPATRERPPLFGGPALLTASIAAAFLLVLCTYVLWSITSPLASFAGAAEAFGRSLKDGPPLREKGPNEIAKLARVLNIMRSRIASLIQERTSMLVAIGHELRTPLTRIVLQAERLPASPARQTMLNDLTSMGELLSNMLSYLRGEAGTESHQNVDLPSLVQTICSTFADRGRPISYEGRDHLVYSCRPNRLTRALSSIFENSLEYNSECSVALDVLPSGDVYIVVCPPEAKGSLSQCHTEALGKPSLSLSLAKDIVESHGGTVEFGVVPPQGLCARIKLSAQPCSVRELPPITDDAEKNGC